MGVGPQCLTSIKLIGMLKVVIKHTHTTKYGSTPAMSMVIATYNYGYT
jgi:hypothetical protein